jgi:8-oxo-dGTP diphosphatase
LPRRHARCCQDALMAHHDVAVAVIRHEGEALLCHRSATREWFPDCWDIVGGHIERGESAEAAIVRECREELGITARTVQPIPVHFDDPAITMHAFVIDAWEGEITNRAPEEHDKVEWFAPDGLHGLNLADPRFLPWLIGLLS